MNSAIAYKQPDLIRLSGGSFEDLLEAMKDTVEHAGEGAVISALANMMIAKTVGLIRTGTIAELMEAGVPLCHFLNSPLGRKLEEQAPGQHSLLWGIVPVITEASSLGHSTGPELLFRSNELARRVFDCIIEHDSLAYTQICQLMPTIEPKEIRRAIVELERTYLIESYGGEFYGGARAYRYR